MEKVINKLLGLFNLGIVKIFPRHSIRFAKDYFKNKKIVVIEIGTWKGENALSILKELNVEKIYLIDPYEEYEDYKKSEGDKIKERLSKAEKSAKKRLKKYSDKIVWIRDFSDRAVKRIKEKVDFIYIDGNHEYEYVKRDMENYWPLVKRGGIMAGHDITNEKFNQGIFKALKEFSNKKKVSPYISRIDWWIVKNE